MAATLTQQQAQDIQTMMANVEAAYQSNAKARTALSGLLAVGRATCQDVVAFNLATKAIWAYQASVAGIIRANGGDAPVVPAPLYIGWRGVQGDAAVDIDCGSAQMRGAGLGATSTGDVFIDPTKVEWRPGATPRDVATVNQIVAAGNRAIAAGAPGLGEPISAITVVTIVIVGILVVTSLIIILKVVEALTDVPQKREQTRQIAIQRQAHQASLEKRWACYNDCAKRGRDPVECAKACDRLTPEFKPVIPSGGLGLVGTIAGVTVLGLVIYASWRFVAGGGLDRRRGGGGGGRKALPSGRDQIIDAEYEEHAA